jgi:hypothetical protein
MSQHFARPIMFVPAPVRERTRPRMRLVVTVMVLVMVVAALAFSLVPMRIKSVSVSGARLLSRGEVIQLAGIPSGRALGWREARRIEERLAKHPAFSSVRVSRGFDGTLGLHVVERAPVAWLVTHGCAVAADGTLLPYLNHRDEGWVALTGVEVKDGKADMAAVAEAMSGYGHLREIATQGKGVLRRVGSGEGVWEWDIEGKKVVFSSPVREEEIKRLQRFQREYPRAWGKARMVDLRFAERVVVKK